MPEKKPVGVFWGENSLFFVEATLPSPKKFFSVPLMTEKGALAETSQSQKVVNLSSLITNSFSKQNINPATVNLSLPTKEIIFRTFTIPWMQSHELKAVVSFEASKYIPFPLDDLSYAFHPIASNEGGNRRIHIILVAIKKNILDNYISILEQSNLNVGIVEPSFLSLIRTLNSSNNLPPQQTVAIFERKANTGEIIIAHQGIPHFVREFPLSPTSASKENSETENTTREINEIRISLDYFNRQENQLRVNELLLLSPSTDETFSKSLGSELGIPVKLISFQSLLGNNRISEPDYINAFGAGISDSVESSANFDLSRKKASFSRIKISSIKQIANFRTVLIVFFICVGLGVLTWFITRGFVSAPQKEIASLKQRLGVYESASMDKLKETNTSLQEKLDTLKQLTFDKNQYLLLSTLSQLLPDGVWLDSLEIATIPLTAANKTAKKNSPNVIINMQGFAFSENVNKEFQLVTKFQENLQTNKELDVFFNKNINLEDVKAQKLNDYDVVYFKIKCQAKL